MDRQLKILMIEDTLADTELMLREIRRSGLACTAHRVETERNFRESLEGFAPDIILSDFSLPAFDGMSALVIARAEKPETPFIFVSGTIGEERAIESLKRGAADYVLKANIGRLPSAISRALEQAGERAARKRAEHELRASVERFEIIARATNDAIWDWDLTDDSVWWNQGFENLFGYVRAEVEPDPKSWTSRIHPQDLDRVGASIERAIGSDERCWNAEYRFRRADGNYAYVLNRGYIMRDDAGTPLRMIGAMMDITERRVQQEKIARLSRIHSVLSGINAAIVRIHDRRDLLSEATRIAVEHGGFRLAWIGLAEEPGDRRSGKTRPPPPTASMGCDAEGIAELRLAFDAESSMTRRALESRQAVITGDIAADEELAAIREGAIRRGFCSAAAIPLMAGGRALGALALFAGECDFFDREEMKLLSELVADIAFALEYIEKDEKLNYLAYYDALTGLPNRSLFLDRLQQLVQGVQEGKRRIAVFAINVERFRLINELLGRQGGDELMKLLGDSLSAMLQGADQLAHIGGDQFALTLAEAGDPDLASFLEHKIIAALDRSYVIRGVELRVGLKAGIAVFPNDGDAAEELLANAETALQKAKDNNEKYLFYTPQHNARIAHKLSLETRLRKALNVEQFVLHYQPKVDLAHRQLTGFEALIRWSDPEDGLRAPDDFIPALEETGLIIDVGRWVIAQASADHMRWRVAGLNPPEIAINVSALQLRRKDFVAELRSVLRETGIDPSLAVELTESVVMNDLNESIAKIRAIRDMGVSIAIDDFGTGYSSLSYIARLPVNVLKIDRSFMTNLVNDRYSRTIVATVISLAGALDLKVVAEGVETEAQAAMLQLLRCDEMQGHLSGRPLPAAEVEKLLAAGRSG